MRQCENGANKELGPSMDLNREIGKIKKSSSDEGKEKKEKTQY